MRSRDRARVLEELQSRVVDEVVKSGAVLDVVANSVYFETQRLKDDRSADDEERGFWRHAQADMRGASERALRDVLRRVVDRYAHEISGKFDERVYDAVTRAGEPVLGLLLNAVSPKKLLTTFPNFPRFDDALVLQGEIAQLKKLRERGTIILVPTHMSHMDSIATGYALWKIGLPPFTYGAGLNLFTNPMLGFFMRNLGAYTVDRRKRDPLYKSVLKEYATLTLENSYDNIFFPGGTRSRSGAVEKKLKLGLLGTGISAYVHNLRTQKKRERVYIVPATLSYQLVLEAETLIDDFLKEVGKSRYIITDDEFSHPRKVYDFMNQLLGLDSKIMFTVGRALDPFGHDVDDDGESLDARGRRIDPSRYVMEDGAFTIDEQRDEEYTREVGERIMQAYARDSVIQSTHLTAHALLNCLRVANPGIDLVRLLRAGGRVDDIPLLDVYNEARRLLDELRGLSARGGVRLSPLLHSAGAEDVVADGLRTFSIYHARPAAQRKGDRLSSGDRSLLFFYSNRLEGYRLERALGLKPALSPDHRSIGKGA